MSAATSKAIALLDAFDSGADLSMWDSQGDVRAQLLLAHDTPVFTLSDTKGVAAFENTPGEGAHLQVFNKQRREVWRAP